MLSGLLAGYRSFFALPDVTRLVAMAMVARMPLGTHGLALLLHVRALTDSFATAGSAVGTYLAASAVTAPVVGRIVDRIGPRKPLLVMGIACPVALVFVLAARPLHLTPPLILLFAGVGGAFAPPITVLTRTMWRYRFEDDGIARRTAFAVDAVLVELAFTLGPALIALLVAVAGATTAYAAAVIFTALAVPVFFASPALRYWKHESGIERHLLGPLTAPRLLLVYLLCALLTFCLGLLEVAYPAFAAALGATALSGVLLAVNSTGSALGGLAYGGSHIAMPVERQLRALLVLLGLSLGVQAFVSSAWLLGVLAFVGGLFIAPSLTAVTLLVSANAPARYATEAFTWAATCIVAGVGAGMAVGGNLVEASGASGVFAAAGWSALVAAACALGLRAHEPRVQ
ncbi:MAG TPA: MFS transporter [Casimicrobiaceae bacterium]|jgi:MFS family permease